MSIAYQPQTPPKEDYELVSQSVPVFAEHERDGEVYGQQELQWIAANQNRRIEDTGDYVPIIIRHNPVDGGDDRPVVGYAGPFEVAQHGKTGKAAIFAKNWWIKKDRLEEVKNYSRRSVELWKEPNMMERFFDPIAILGSETPELDLGVLYAKSGKVDRYEAVFPGGGNTFIPSDKDHYQEPTMTPEDIQAIVAALYETAEFQYLKRMMETEEANSEPEIAPEPAAEVAPEAAPEAAAAPPFGEQEEQLRKYMADDDAEGAAQYMSDCDDEAKDHFAKYEADDEFKDFYGRLSQYMSDEEPETYQEDDDVAKESYKRERKLKDDYAKLRRDHDELKATVDSQKQEARRAVRYQRLNELSFQYALDADEEIKDVESMSDEAWDKHQDRIVNRYQRIPAGERILNPSSYAKADDDDKGPKPEHFKKARELAQREKINFKEAVDRVMESVA